MEKFWVEIATHPLMEDLLAHLRTSRAVRYAHSSDIHLYSHEMGRREGFEEALITLFNGPSDHKPLTQELEPYKAFKPPIKHV